MIKIKNSFEILDLLYDNFVIGKYVDFEEIGVDYKNKNFSKLMLFLIKCDFVDAERKTIREDPRNWSYFPKAKITIEGIKFALEQRSTKKALKLTRSSLRLTRYTLIVAIIALVLSVVFQFLIFL